MLKDILNTLIERKDLFISLTLQHLSISYIVLVIASIVGITLALIILKYKKGAGFVLSSVNFLYTIPSIAMFGLLIPLSGIGDKTAIIALSIYALLPITINTYTGLNNVSEEYIFAAKAMGSTNFQILKNIKFPLALPFIFSGIRSALIMTIALTGIAAFIGAGGIGVAIYRGLTTNNMNLTIAGSLLIAILAICSDFFLQFMSSSCCNRKKSSIPSFIIIILITISLIVYNYGGKNTFKNQKIITIATKPMTEQYIMGDILKEYIEKNTDYKVNLVSGVGGGTSNIHIGMENKKFDMYIEYTGTTWNQVLKEKTIYNEDKFQELNKLYEEKYHMRYLLLFGFNNTFGIAVRKSFADKYNIKTYSDLSKYSNLISFGAEYDFFERLDGYKALKDTYNFNFKNTKDMDVSLKYKAINENKIDSIVVFTTDARLNSPNITVLEDDKKFYPSYKAGIVVRDDIYQKDKDLMEKLMVFKNILNDKEITKLNYDVEVKQENIKDVAHNFLLEKGLINEK